MRVAIDFDDLELQPAVQKHLDGQVASVQLYIKAALGFYNAMIAGNEANKRLSYVNDRGYAIGELIQPLAHLKLYK